MQARARAICVLLLSSDPVVCCRVHQTGGCRDMLCVSLSAVAGAAEGSKAGHP